MGCASPQTVHEKPYVDALKSYDDLKNKYKEGVDYSVIVKDRKSSALVMSLHGCKIEPGTTELAEAIAEKSKSKFYAFCGLLNHQQDDEHLFDGELHITSTHYQEARLQKLTSTSKTCLSLHGFGNHSPDFCVGGANEKLRARILGMLQKQFPEHSSCELCCKPYNGVAKTNPVNECQNQGVQIEMSPLIRRKILAVPVFKKALSESLSQVLNQT